MSINTKTVSSFLHQSIINFLHMSQRLLLLLITQALSHMHTQWQTGTHSTHKYMSISFRFPSHLLKGFWALRIRNLSLFCFFILFSLFLWISTWMNVWLCYFSRTGRLAHVVDSLIKASLENWAVVGLFLWLDLCLRLFPFQLSHRKGHKGQTWIWKPPEIVRHLILNH